MSWKSLKNEKPSLPPPAVIIDMRGKAPKADVDEEEEKDEAPTFVRIERTDGSGNVL